ncbi:DUF4040 domain-containing protein [bacterium]|nr:DUF4040 domain-containing protein [bacterium]
MIIFLLIFLGIIMLVAAIFAVMTKELIAAILATGLIGLMASVIFIVLAAPDVAMTEAAIGSGLTMVVFLLALRRIRQLGGSDND